MATNFSLFLLLSSLLLLAHARDSQFFAKVSNNNPQLTPTKQSQSLNTNSQDPTFVPLSQEDGGSYGLYGHGSGQLPPSTTTSANDNLPTNLPENYNPVAYTTPIHSNTQDFPNNYNQDSYVTQPEAYQYNDQSKMYKQDQFFDNGKGMYNSQKQEIGTNGGNMYNMQKQGMSDTRFLENGRYYQGSEMYNPQKQGLGETGTYNSQKQGNGYKMGMEKQGMSDTRFLENGKYYYDLNSENLNANANGYSTNGYNTRGYSGNNNDNSYDRYNYNNNGEYQNLQEEYEQNQEDEFNP